MSMRFNQRLLLSFVAPSTLLLAALVASIVSLNSTRQAFDRYLGTEAALANDVRAANSARIHEF